MRIDKDWLRIMTRAEEMRNAVAAASSDLLRSVWQCLRRLGVSMKRVPDVTHRSDRCRVCRSSLPALYTDLERCQKSLEGYLEKKRARFPRFYFVSNPVLLQVLSQGSDPKAMQPYYEKLFDSIDRVVHDRKTPNAIVQFRSIIGKDTEDVNLSHVMHAGTPMSTRGCP